MSVEPFTGAATVTAPSVLEPPFGPLAVTLEKLRGHGQPGVAVQAGPPDPSGWRCCDELVVGDGDELRVLLSAIGERNQAPRRDVQASFLVTIHAWTLTSVGLGTFVVDRRVPDLAPSNVWFNRDQVAAEPVALAGGRFWCLACDPAAHHPLATPVATTVELLLILRRQLEDHLAAVFAALRATKPRLGETAMWALAADNLVAAAIARRPGAPLSDVASLIAPFVRDPSSRFAGKSWVFELPDDAHHRIWTFRHGCCLSYKLGDDMKCPLCPLRPLPARMEALRQYLACHVDGVGSAER